MFKRRSLGLVDSPIHKNRKLISAGKITWCIGKISLSLHEERCGLDRWEKRLMITEHKLIWKHARTTLDIGQRTCLWSNVITIYVSGLELKFLSCVFSSVSRINGSTASTKGSQRGSQKFLRRAIAFNPGLTEILYIHLVLFAVLLSVLLTIALEFFHQTRPKEQQLPNVLLGNVY